MAAKKKKSTKKGATKNGATKRKRSATNPLKLSLTVHAVMKIERGQVFLVKAHGDGKSSVELGHVTAGSEAEAKKHAKSFARKLL